MILSANSIWLNCMWVVSGGFLGAVTRYAISKWLVKQSERFPVATLLINATGAFLLGLLYGMDTGSVARLFFGTGFLGAYTTFSTMAYEVLGLALSKRRQVMFLYLGISMTVGVIAAYAGMIMGMNIRT